MSRVAAINLRVGVDKRDTLARAADLIARAAADGARFVALPECFVGKYGVARFPEHAESLDATDDESGCGVLAAAARRHGVTTTGGVIERADGRLWNSMPVFGPDGALVTNYRKVHLSRVLGITSESDVLEAGEATTAYDVDDFRVGAACCFDLRFPEWLRRYGPRGARPADVLCAPSAFLDVTGKPHWDLLLRRTALDAQAYVVAPNVAYDDADEVPLHGRSAIVDPWGDVLAQTAADADDIAIADVSRERTDEVRRKLPLGSWPE
mmetsp:Transcript_36157/g.111886  ORF Transcript_36157/g.111886 Transcript_36157/m.111886 type:complete len:267 (-) Transcript_36157:9-809(-)